MIDWLDAMVELGLGVGMGALWSRRQRGAQLPIAQLASAASSLVEVIGRLEARATTAPLSRHPCAAWWCWVAELEASGQWRERGAAVSAGPLRLVDATGAIELSSDQCRLSLPPGRTAEVEAHQWAEGGPVGEELRQLCHAAGVEHPEASPRLRLAEVMLPLGVIILARGMVIQGPDAQEGLYRGAAVDHATLGPPPEGFIELTPR